MNYGIAQNNNSGLHPNIQKEKERFEGERSIEIARAPIGITRRPDDASHPCPSMVPLAPPSQVMANYGN